MTDKLSGMRRLAEISQRINGELCDLAEESDLVLDPRTVDRLVGISEAMGRANEYVQNELHKAEKTRIDEVFSTSNSQAEGRGSRTIPRLVGGQP